MRNGFVLPATLVLLLALTLVATGAMRAAGMESQLAGHAAEHAEAFESSESVRRLFEPVLHAALEGDAAALQAASGAGWTLADPTGVSLATNDDEAANCATPFTRADGTSCTLKLDARFARNIAPTNEPARWLRGEIAVFRVRAPLAPGTGSIVVIADGTVTSVPTATGAAESYFYVESRSDGTTGQARTRVITAAIVRHAAGTATISSSASPNRNGEIDWRERRP